MFWDYQPEYAPSSQSSCPSMSTSSFRSSTSYDMSDITTPPPSTRRSSLASLKLEDMNFSPTHTPEGYGTSCGMSSVSSNDMASGFTDQSVIFPDEHLMQDQALFTYSGFPKYNTQEFQRFQSSHGLTIQTPSLEMDLISPISVMESSLGSMDFVDPFQTTFVNTVDVDTPMPLMRGLHFESPTSDYASHRSFDVSPMANLALHLQYEDCKSASTTPSRTSTTPCRSSKMRQPIFEPVRSSAALQRAQSDPQAARRARKRMQRELPSGVIPSNIRIQHAADKPCLYPGCDRKFKRQEHLKRHEKIHYYDPDTDSFPCEFCKHRFNRSDNLKSHMRLHTDPVKTKRTEFFPRAQAVYDAMDSKKKKRSKSQDDVKIEGRPRPRSRVTG